MPRSVLVTGGTGFIGAAVSHALLDSGHAVTAFGRQTALRAGFDWQRSGLVLVVADLAEREKLCAAVAECDVVFHKASISASKANNSQEFFHSNIEGTRALLESLRAQPSPIQQLIFDSSISVYGEGCYQCPNCGVVRGELRTMLDIDKNGSFELFCKNCAAELTPTETPETEMLNGMSQYALTKKFQEEMLIAGAKQMGFQLTILRYATVYGAAQRESNVYRLMLKRMINGQEVTLNEDGLQKRDFVHVDDVVAANLLALNQPGEDHVRILNIGSGRETTLRGFFDLARSICLADLDCKPGTEQTTNALVPGDIRHCKIQVSAAEDALGFTAARGLRDGLSILLKSLLTERSSC